MRTSPPFGETLDGQFTPVDELTAQQWREAGWWEGRSIRSLLTEVARERPELTALIGHRSDGGRITRSYDEFDRNAHRAAAVFDSLGVRTGDAVVVMLPNWVEYAEIVFGINEIGGIYAGIPVAYGEKQAAEILRRSKAKVLIIPRRWRSNDHLALSRSLRSEISTLNHVLVVDDDATGLGEGESLWSAYVPDTARQYQDPEANRLCYLGFTSGTTGEPKGAMHTHDTLIYSARQQAKHVDRATWGNPMVQLVASPVGHHTGFEWGILFTVLMAGTAVHVDHWNPSWGASIIRDEHVTCFFGAPTFLQDMLGTDLVDDPGNPLSCLVIAGSAIPRNLPAHAQAVLGAYVCPAWGMTECSIMTSCSPAERDDIHRTDGSVFAGSAVKVVDPFDNEVPSGQIGELLMRGPGIALGYYDRPDATADAYCRDLWFRTGDRASVDRRGWLSLHGRTKDIVIRGGENISVTDVESVLFDHPDILNAAVIGVSDARLGERVCAVIVLRPGRVGMSTEELASFLLEEGLSRHFLPERVVVLPELPMTPSGKIQKFKLRDMIA
ncbi:cyclohexanecarboxylate-CoA ligase [Rhodococcus sp. 06-1059B-a]|nr:AMP-binding protein [Rhodococcus sp. 06-1059B-a]OZD68970.1 cyclohexanecarboxylate-CoA ligase [Rhodococcus sp. 06-1059B-a]